MSTPTPDHFTARSALSLVVLSGAVALDIGSVAIVNPALPDIGRGLAIGPDLLQWTVTAYGVGFAGFLLLGGRLADLVGRRLVLGAGAATFTVGAVVTATATGTVSLIVGRGLQGLGAALSVPAALALVFQVFEPGPLRHRALAVYTGVGAAGFGVGLVAGGLLTSTLGWRWVFIVSALAGALVAVGVRTALPASTGRPGRLDVAGSVFGTAALSATIVAVSGLGGAGDRPTIAVAAAAAVVLGAGFVLRERLTSDALFPARVIRPGPARAAAVGGAAFFFALNGVLFLVPLYTQGLLGYTPLQSGLAVLPMAVVVSAVSQVAGRLLSRVDARRLLVTGLLVLGAGTLLWIHTSDHSVFVVHVLPPVLVMALGQGIAYPALTAASLAGIAPDDHAVAGAVNVTAQQVGAGFGVAAVAAVSAAAGADGGPARQLAAYHLSYVLMAGVLVIASLVVALLSRDRRPAPAPSR